MVRNIYACCVPFVRVFDRILVYSPWQLLLVLVVAQALRTSFDLDSFGLIWGSCCVAPVGF